MNKYVQRLMILTALLAVPLALVIATFVLFQSQADASSHREAPLISKDAYADNTDVYAFISPEDDNNIVLAASWIPFEGPEGGPNYYEWDPMARYDIFVDSDGDASPNYTYTLSSKVVVQNPSTFLYALGEVDSLTSPNLNRVQFITITETTENGVSTNLVANQRTAPVNIGSKFTPNYSKLESEAIFTALGGAMKLYAGPTDDAFWVDLQVFDKLTLRGQPGPVGYETGNNIPVDSVAGYNVHSMVLEIPISRLVKDGEPVLGVWAGTRRPTMDVLNNQSVTGYTQISRLGMPLVNEVVLPLALKDAFNGLRPEQDLTLYVGGTSAIPLLQRSVEDPEVGRLLCTFYDVSLPRDTDNDCSTEVIIGAPASGRGDIFEIFLTGMVTKKDFPIILKDGSTLTLKAPFTVTQPSNVRPAEMLRINTSIKGDLCSPTPHRLGLLGGDACGFPNGRRLTDDVVDIELLAVAGAAFDVLDGRDPDFAFEPALIGVLDDGLYANDVPFRNTFPYMAQAQSGQEHIHQNPITAYFLPFVRKVAISFQNGAAGMPMQPIGAVVTMLLVGAPALALLWRRREDR